MTRRDPKRDVGSPYSGGRPASPRIFSEYRDQQSGTANPSEIVKSLSRDQGDNSYWIVGERKLGKTSFLLKIEDLLLNRMKQSGNRWIALPLYVSCIPHSDLQSFYRALLARVKEIFNGSLDLPHNEDKIQLPLDECRLPTLEANTDAGSLLELLVHDLNVIVESADQDRCRVVILIDDADFGVASGWAKSLFSHIKSLLTNIHHYRDNQTLSQDNVAIIMASRCISTDGFSSRIDTILKEVHLRSLKPSEARDLVTTPLRVEINTRWVDRIYRATGGSAWLIQYVMEQFLLTCGEDLQEFDQQFENIIGSRFLREIEHRNILSSWFKSLPERDITVLSHLAAHSQGLSISELADKLGIKPVTLHKRLRPAVDLGIIFKTKANAHGSQQTKPRCSLAGIFERWFLEQSGGKVFRDELEVLRARVNSQAISSAKSFKLLLSLKPGILLMDGLYTRVAELSGTILNFLKKLRRRTRKISSVEDIQDVTSDLSDYFAQTEWQKTWNHYHESILDDSSLPRFVLQTRDIEFLEFPVELLDFEKRPLGLHAPTFIELLDLQSEASYRIKGNCLPPNEPINILLIASSVGGKINDQRLADLPESNDEIGEIRQAVTAQAAKSEMVLGEILILGHPNNSSSKNVSAMPATCDHFERALRGDLGVSFHIVHYSGHYLYSKEGDDAGLLFCREGRLELFSLTRLYQAVRDSDVRLAFFNRCSSGQSSSSGSYLGAAHTCLQAGVPATIGMRWPVPDAQAREFAVLFYRTLNECHYSPDIALWKTRMKMESHDATKMVWAAPVMMTR